MRDKRLAADGRPECVVIPGNTSSQGKFVDPPTSVTASAGNGQATVSFTLPAYDGKGVATYVATSSPSGITGSGAGSPITVTGLSNGTSYTFTVSTISGYGVSATSAPSNATTPTAPAPPPPPPPPPPPSGPPPPPVCQGCAPHLYGYYACSPSNCGCSSGFSYSCDGQFSYIYLQSPCCPDTAVCGAFRVGVCGYTG